mgnify:FL=1
MQDPAAMLLSKVLGPKNKDEMPYILCRRNFPHQMTYNQHDSTWEGLRRVIQDGRVKWEIHHDFNLIIHAPEGYCKIPNTPNNLKLLERRSKTLIKKETRQTVNHMTGERTEEEIEVRTPPMYERIDDSIAEDQVIDRLMEKIKERQERDKSGAPDPAAPEYVEEVKEAEPEPEMETVPAQPVVSVKRRGRPKKLG